MNLREKKDIRILLYSIYGVACAVWIVIVSCSFTKSHLTLWPHGRQHTRLPCPSPPPGVCSNACSLSQWCYLTISSSATSFSFCLQSFPAWGSFPVSQLFASDGQSIQTSASVLPVNIQGWFHLGLNGLNQGTCKSLLQHHRLKSSILQHSAFFMSNSPVRTCRKPE